MDNLDYANELREVALEFKKYAFEYKKERALYAEAYNKLTNLIFVAGLHNDKASFEKILAKLLATDYAEQAKYYIELLYTSKANYKGWEMILESFKAHISSIQSVIKYNLAGELNENIANKANIDSLMTF
jgi:hypothetical protein